MVFYQKNDFNFIQFQKSNNQKKKYDAILENKKTKKKVKVSFGSKKYQQYYDKIGLYSSQNHLCEKRRHLYILRHQHDINKPYSASWFSLNYLW
jgi:hypothetical protein